METVISEPLLKARDCDRRVLVRQSADKAEFQDSSAEKILKLLFDHCESDEEGVRGFHVRERVCKDSSNWLSCCS